MSDKKQIDRLVEDLNRFDVNFKETGFKTKKFKLGDAVNKITKGYEKITLLLLCLVFLVSSTLAFYHFGIEQGFFKESLSCTTGDLSKIMNPHLPNTKACRNYLANGNPADLDVATGAQTKNGLNVSAADTSPFESDKMVAITVAQADSVSSTGEVTLYIDYQQAINDTN